MSKKSATGTASPEFMAGTAGGGTDKKSVVSERRRIQMKWCEEQRFKLQNEVQELMDSVKDIQNMREGLLADSQWISKMKLNIMKQLQPGECDNPIPDFVRKFYKMSGGFGFPDSDEDKSSGDGRHDDGDVSDVDDYMDEEDDDTEQQEKAPMLMLPEGDKN